MYPRSAGWTKYREKLRELNQLKEEKLGKFPFFEFLLANRNSIGSRDLSWPISDGYKTLLFGNLS